MNIKEIQELILTMDKTSIEKVDIENSEIKISLSKNNKVEIVASELASSQNREINNIVESNMINTQTEAIMSNQTQQEEITEPEDTFVVKSPIVGTYYEAASPDSAAFVKVGDIVKEGQTLCIVEAMKIMNQIESEVSGEICEILVKNEDVVEYNQPLMVIRR